MTVQEWRNLVEKKKVILDGATGSNLLAAGMPRGICTESWVLEHPEVVEKLQKGYLEAGSDIVYAPTFSANRICMEDYGLTDRLEEMNHQLVAISRKAVGQKILVAGDMTTTGKTDLSYDTLFEVYREQISYLYDAGVDVLVAETMVTLDETMAAVDAARSVCELPILCSLTIEADGSLFFGGDVFEAATALAEMDVDAVGINCSTGPDQLESVISTLHRDLTIPIIAKPNAGMPTIDAQGNAIYNMNAKDFARHMRRLVDLGAGCVGGCCGTTPEYIRTMCSLF